MKRLALYICACALLFPLPTKKVSAEDESYTVDDISAKDRGTSGDEHRRWERSSPGMAERNDYEADEPIERRGLCSRFVNQDGSQLQTASEDKEAFGLAEKDESETERDGDDYESGEGKSARPNNSEAEETSAEVEEGRATEDTEMERYWQAPGREDEPSYRADSCICSLRNGDGSRNGPVMRDVSNRHRAHRHWLDKHKSYFVDLMMPIGVRKIRHRKYHKTIPFDSPNRQGLEENAHTTRRFGRRLDSLGAHRKNPNHDSHSVPLEISSLQANSMAIANQRNGRSHNEDVSLSRGNRSKNSANDSNDYHNETETRPFGGRKMRRTRKWPDRSREHVIAQMRRHHPKRYFPWSLSKNTFAKSKHEHTPQRRGRDIQNSTKDKCNEQNLNTSDFDNNGIDEDEKNSSLEEETLHGKKKAVNKNSRAKEENDAQEFEDGSKAADDDDNYDPKLSNYERSSTNDENGRAIQPKESKGKEEKEDEENYKWAEGQDKTHDEGGKHEKQQGIEWMEKDEENIWEKEDVEELMLRESEEEHVLEEDMWDDEEEENIGEEKEHKESIWNDEQTADAEKEIGEKETTDTKKEFNTSEGKDNNDKHRQKTEERKENNTWVKQREREKTTDEDTGSKPYFEDAEQGNVKTCDELPHDAGNTENKRETSTSMECEEIVITQNGHEQAIKELRKSNVTGIPQPKNEEVERNNESALKQSSGSHNESSEEEKNPTQMQTERRSSNKTQQGSEASLDRKEADDHETPIPGSERSTEPEDGVPEGNAVAPHESRTSYARAVDEYDNTYEKNSNSDEDHDAEQDRKTTTGEPESNANHEIKDVSGSHNESNEEKKPPEQMQTDQRSSNKTQQRSETSLDRKEADGHETPIPASESSMKPEDGVPEENAVGPRESRTPYARAVDEYDNTYEKNSNSDEDRDAEQDRKTTTREPESNANHEIKDDKYQHAESKEPRRVRYNFRLIQRIVKMVLKHLLSVARNNKRGKIEIKDLRGNDNNDLHKNHQIPVENERRNFSEKVDRKTADSEETRQESRDISSSYDSYEKTTLMKNSNMKASNNVYASKTEEPEHPKNFKADSSAASNANGSNIAQDRRTKPENGNKMVHVGTTAEDNFEDGKYLNTMTEKSISTRIDTRIFHAVVRNVIENLPSILEHRKRRGKAIETKNDRSHGMQFEAFSNQDSTRAEGKEKTFENEEMIPHSEKSSETDVREKEDEEGHVAERRSQKSSRAFTENWLTRENDAESKGGLFSDDTLMVVDSKRASFADSSGQPTDSANLNRQGQETLHLDPDIFRAVFVKVAENLPIIIQNIKQHRNISSNFY